MPSKADTLDAILGQETFSLGPVKLTRGGGSSVSSSLSRDDEPGATISFWSSTAGKHYEFVGEVSALSTPKALQAVTDRVKRLVERTSKQVPEPQWIQVPLVIAPYLSERRLTELASQGVSGLDLCGNGVLVAEGLYVFKAGQKNRYPQSTCLLKAYQSKSSLVPRALLMQPRFQTVKDLVEFINDQRPPQGGRQDAEISFSQVSKALKQLEEDLVVTKERGGVRLLQPEALLNALVREYKRPRVIDRWIGRCSDAALTAVLRKIGQALGDPDIRVAEMSYWVAGRGIGFAGEPIRSIFTDAPVMQLFEGIDDGIEQGRRFANLEILRTHSDWVYFGRSRNYGDASVSDLQIYLELANGDTRQKQAAEQLRQGILQDLAKWRDAS